ncbi:MAG TPA: DUF4190 domain-containing protein [Bacteroidia bacterium]|nr:DUF4190 domain-containing protein [Bacteroidia bacterium]
MRGYHVEWNKKGNEISLQPEIKNSIGKNSVNRIIALNLKKEDSLNPAHQLDLKTFTPETEKGSAAKHAAKKDTANSSRQKFPASKPADDKKTNQMAAVSFGFAFVELIGLAASLALGWGIFFVFLLLGIPAFICGLIALQQIKQAPNSYDNKWHAWVGITVGILGTVVLLIYTVLFVNFFNN